MFSQIVTEGIVDGKDLTLSVTLGLNGKFHKVVIIGDTRRVRQARGWACIHARSRDSLGVSTGHLGFHAADFIEAIEVTEGDEFRLVIEHDVSSGRRSAIGTHIGENITSYIVFQLNYRLYLYEYLVSIFRSERASRIR